MLEFEKFPSEFTSLFLIFVKPDEYVRGTRIQLYAFYCLIVNTNLGCHNAQDGGTGRKKRQATSFDENVERTRRLREFFSNCLMEQVSQTLEHCKFGLGTILAER